MRSAVRKGKERKGIKKGSREGKGRMERKGKEKTKGGSNENEDKISRTKNEYKRNIKRIILYEVSMGFGNCQIGYIVIYTTELRGTQLGGGYPGQIPPSALSILFVPFAGPPQICGKPIFCYNKDIIIIYLIP